MKSNNYPADMNVFHSLCEQWIEPMLIIKGSYFVYSNVAAVDILSLKNKDEMYQVHPSEISPKYQPDGILSYIKAEEMFTLCYEKGMLRFPWMYQNKFKEEFWVEVTIVEVHLDNCRYLLCSWRCITGCQKLQALYQDPIGYNNSKIKQHEHFKKHLISNDLPLTTEHTIQTYNLLSEHKKAIDISAIVSKTDYLGVITYVNENFCHTSGYSIKELIGKKHSIIKHPDTSKSIFENLWSEILKGNIWQGIIKNKNKAGKSYYVNTTICPIYDINNKIKEFIAIRYDVTDIYRKNLIIKNQNTDPLTQLGNATKLLSDINKHQKRTLILIKIKELIDIQQAYGFDIYNEALCIVSQKIKSRIHDNFNIYRWSEDVFAILAPEKLDVERVTKRCEYIQSQFESNFLKIQGNEFFMTMRIGIALNCLCKNIYTDAQKALINSIKNNQTLTIYSNKIDIQQQLISCINWSRKIKLALTDDDIKIFGQNIYDKNRKEYSTEVLMRYFDKKTKEYISPFVFLKHAEKAQLYTKLSMKIIEKSFYYFSNKSERFSINLNMNDIKDKIMSSWIIDIINYYGIGNYLTIELVESTNYELESDFIFTFLNKVKALGCKIAIDDFGSGYSNFEYLMLMPVDVIKIDGSLIKNIHEDKKTFEIVKTLIQFCKAMELKIVVEYVENKKTFELLKLLHVDYFQGYYFHKPTILI